LIGEFAGRRGVAQVGAEQLGFPAQLLDVAGGFLGARRGGRVVDGDVASGPRGGRRR